MAKLYDDDENIDDEMKVFDMDRESSGEEEVKPVKAREEKVS